MRNTYFAVVSLALPGGDAEPIAYLELDQQEQPLGGIMSAGPLPQQIRWVLVSHCRYSQTTPMVELVRWWDCPDEGIPPDQIEDEYWNLLQPDRPMPVWLSALLEQLDGAEGSLS